MTLTVRRTSEHVDRWDALRGETRWVDYSCQQSDGELVVYIHTFRRVRERLDASGDLLLWKPDTTRIAHRYGADEWAEVTREERDWPPAGVERVERTVRRRARRRS